MKKMISTLVISSIIAAHSMASHRLSDLRIRSFDNRPVMVSINHSEYRSAGVNAVVRDIMPGRHQIRIWTKVPGPYNWNHGRVLLYNGFIDIPAASEIRATVTRNRNLRINEIIPLFAPEPCEPYPYPAPLPGPYGTPQPSCINDATFQGLLNTIAAQAFESTRMNITIQAIRQNGVINTAQVGALMNMMSFESSKLEIAKFAYAYTFDKENYFRLYDEFSFDSSVNELIRYIDHQG